MTLAVNSYPGSKGGSGVWQKIISQMPVHERYYELFLGKGAVLRAKRPAPRETIGLDVDPKLIDWWERQPLPPKACICEGDAMEWMSSRAVFQDPQALVYLDPPYLLETRSESRLRYDHEFHTIEEHEAMLKLIRKLKCMVMISGYASVLYAQLLHDWRQISFAAGTRGSPRVENLWCNFPAGLPLHDPRWVGTNYRERERIKRKRQRWAQRFEAMPPAERQVIREALDAVDHRRQ